MTFFSNRFGTGILEFFRKSDYKSCYINNTSEILAMFMYQNRSNCLEIRSTDMKNATVFGKEGAYLSF